MNHRTVRLGGLAALVGWGLVLAYFLVSHVLGAMYDPKALLDQNPNVTPQQWTEIRASPIQRAREAMIPVWRLSRYIVPALVLTAGFLTWRWWRLRSNRPSR